MRKLLATATIAALALAILAVAATAAGKPVAFVGKYHGNAVVKQSDSAIAITAAGSGSGTLIGAGKISGVGAGTTAEPCVPFTGTGSMKGSGGTITFKVNPGASSCGDEGAHTFAFTGKAAVLKGTGKLLRAKGTLKMTGTYDHDSGAFSVKFSGALVK